jgi:hypothetical protein
MDILDSDGNFNEVKLSDLVDGVLPASFLTDKFNQSDDTKKWFMTEVFKTPIPERADPTTQDIDGVPLIVRQGILNYSGTFYGKKAHPKYSGQLNGFQCKDVGVMTVDVSGNLKGKLVEDENGDLVLRPRQLEPDTLYAKYMEPTATEVQNINLKFVISELELDSDLNYLPASAIETNLKTASGVLDVVFTLSNVSTTGGTLVAEYIYGPMGATQPHTGLVVADLIGFNVTDNALLNITDVVEDSETDGTYELTWDAQTGGDVVRISLDENGFDAEPVEGTIPT